MKLSYNLIKKKEMSSISKIVDLISDFLEASHDHKDTYYHITESLVNRLDLKACSYYSLSPYCSLLKWN